VFAKKWNSAYGWQLKARRTDKSIYHEENAPAFSVASMRFTIVANKIAHALAEYELTPVFQLSGHFPFNTKEHMSFLTPVIGEIPRRIFHAPDTDIVEMTDLPGSNAGNTFVFFFGNIIPTECFEGKRRYLHLFGLIPGHGRKHCVFI
jgi:hypothetical protein